jgi:hypothetical protein
VCPPIYQVAVVRVWLASLAGVVPGLKWEISGRYVHAERELSSYSCRLPTTCLKCAALFSSASALKTEFDALISEDLKKGAFESAACFLLPASPKQKSTRMANKPQSSLSSPEYHAPHTVEDVTERNVQAIVELEEAAKAQRSNANRIADVIARFCGSMTFVWVHVVWFTGCVIVNTLAGMPHFDPYPTSLS